MIPLDKGLPKEEIENSLRRSKADAIICEKEYNDLMKEIIEKDNSYLSKIICMDDVEENGIIKSLKNLLKIGKEELDKGNTEYE